MSLVINKEIMRAAYDYLNTTPPFNKWKLPDGEDVKFVVTRSKTDAGWHKIEKGKDIIAASSVCIGRTESLMELVSHEMGHMHQRNIGTETPGVMHNKAFWNIAAKICKYHGYDPKLF